MNDIIFFIYYNQIEKNDYYKFLVNTCNKNDIEYFFDPNKEIFYDRDFNFNEKKQLIFESNLDCISLTNPL